LGYINLNGLHIKLFNLALFLWYLGPLGFLYLLSIYVPGVAPALGAALYEEWIRDFESPHFPWFSMTLTYLETMNLIAATNSQSFTAMGCCFVYKFLTHMVLLRRGTLQYRRKKHFVFNFIATMLLNPYLIDAFPLTFPPPAFVDTRWVEPQYYLAIPTLSVVVSYFMPDQVVTVPHWAPFAGAVGLFGVLFGLFSCVVSRYCSGTTVDLVSEEVAKGVVVPNVLSIGIRNKRRSILFVNSKFRDGLGAVLYPPTAVNIYLQPMSTLTNNKPRSAGKNSRKQRTIAQATQVATSAPANQRLHLDSAKVRGLIKAEMKLARRQSTGVTKSAKSLLANMALPSDAKAVRAASASGSDPTALANLKARETVRFPRSATVDIQQTSHVSFVYRDALRNVITTVGLDPIDNTIYTADIILHSGSQNGTFFPYYETPFIANTASSVLPHGDELYLAVLGETDQFRGALCSAGTILSVGNSALLPGIDYLVQVYKLEGKQWTFFESKPWVSTLAVSFAITVTGYYAFNVVIQGAAAAATADAAIVGTVTLQMSGASGGAMWGQRAAPQIADFKDNIRMYSVLGASGMYTNTASPLNRQGKILGRELPAKANFLEFLDFDVVANQSLAVVKDAPEGMFAFTRPESNNFGKAQPLLYDADDGDNDEYTFLVYPLDPFLIIHASITTTAGQDAYFSRAISLEYTSLSMFIDQHQGTITQSDVQIALKLLSMMPQFHENPLHFDDVWDWIKSTAKDVWAAVKEVAPIAMAAAPLLL